MKKYKYSLEFQINEKEGSELKQETEKALQKEFEKSIKEIEIDHEGNKLSVTDLTEETVEIGRSSEIIQEEKKKLRRVIQTKAGITEKK